MSDTNEEIVDKVLQSLRDTEPPEGMERRILSAVRHRAAATPVPNRIPWRIGSVFGGAVLAGVVCVLFFNVHRKTPHAAFSSVRSVSPRAADAPITPHIAATRKPPKPAMRRARLGPAGFRKEEQLATVSYPAPPMPLTEQEKLLLQIIHQGDPVQVAMLDSVQRDAHYAAEYANFLKFFEP